MQKHFNKFFAATLISRVVGYLRDLMIAYVVGGGYWADLYFASFRLANLFRRLVGEGGLYAAYTPVYSSLLAGDKKNAHHFALSYGALLFVVLFIGVVFCFLLITPLTRLLLPGFVDEPEKLGLAVTLTKILLPFLLFVSLAAWTQATLQANNKFFLSGLSPVFASLSIIVYLLYPHTLIPLSPYTLIHGLAWATTIGGLFQWFIQLPQLKKTVNFEFSFSVHPELKKSLVLFGPYVFTFMIEQINSFVDTFFGTFAETGAIAALYNSSRLIQLPIGLVGVGSLVTALPTMSQLATLNEKGKLRESFFSERKRILLLAIPSVIVFMVLAPWLIRLLYFHGRFDLNALKLTSHVLVLSSPSLLFYSLQKIYLALFYAHRNTKTPMLVSFTQMSLNIVGCALLVKVLGVAGIALTSSIGSCVGFLLMVSLAHRKGYLREK